MLCFNFSAEECISSMPVVSNAKFSLEKGMFWSETQSEICYSKRSRNRCFKKCLTANADAKLCVLALRFTMHHISYLVHYYWLSQGAYHMIHDQDSFCIKGVMIHTSLQSKVSYSSDRSGIIRRWPKGNEKHLVYLLHLLSTTRPLVYSY